MPIVTYPLNNIEYSAEDAELYNSTRTSGIYASGDFNISITGMDNVVTIGKGLGWIKNSEFAGKVIAHKNDTFCNVGIPDAYFPRIDAVVIEFDATRPAEEATKIIVKKGVASSSPVAPEVVRSEYNYELHLYHILRRPGASAIIASDITDLRMNATYCGLMADSVTNVDTSAIDAQIRAMILRLESAILDTQSGHGFTSKTKIWWNNNLDSDFTSENVLGDFEGYDGIEIVYKNKANGREIYSTGFIPAVSGVTIKLEYEDGDNKFTRLALFNYQMNSLAINPCYYMSHTGDRPENNSYLIPYAIYGINGVIDSGSENEEGRLNTNSSLRLSEDKKDVYLQDASYGDSALAAIKSGREILVKVPNASDDNYVANYSPIYKFQVPAYENNYLYLFYIKDENRDLSALLGQPAGTVLVPAYGQLKMLLSREYNSDPLED